MYPKNWYHLIARLRQVLMYLPKRSPLHVRENPALTPHHPTEKLKGYLHAPTKKKERHQALKTYQSEVLDIHHDQNTVTDIGKLSFLSSDDGQSAWPVDVDDEEVIELRASLTESERDSLLEVEQAEKEDAARRKLPTVNELLATEFGKPDKDHSFTQEGAFETIVFLLMKKGCNYLDPASQNNLRAAHPLLDHMHKMIAYYATVDFSSLREYDPNYASQK